MKWVQKPIAREILWQFYMLCYREVGPVHTSMFISEYKTRTDRFLLWLLGWTESRWVEITTSLIAITLLLLVKPCKNVIVGKNEATWRCCEPTCLIWPQAILSILFGWRGPPTWKNYARQGKKIGNSVFFLFSPMGSLNILMCREWASKNNWEPQKGHWNISFKKKFASSAATFVCLYYSFLSSWNRFIRLWNSGTCGTRRTQKELVRQICQVVGQIVSNTFADLYLCFISVQLSWFSFSPAIFQQCRTECPAWHSEFSECLPNIANLHRKQWVCINVSSLLVSCICCEYRKH